MRYLSKLQLALDVVKQNRRTATMVLGLFVVALVVLLPASHWRVIGWLRGESFYDGRPTSYWRAELGEWDFQYSSLTRRPSWAQRTLPNALLVLMGIDEPVFPLQDGNPEATGVLIELLADEDRNISYSAVMGLHRIGPGAQRAIPALKELLRHPDLGLRGSAILALADIGVADEEMIRALTLALTDKEFPALRNCAATALAKLGSKAAPALPQIIYTLTADDPTLVSQADGYPPKLWDVRNQLVDALGQMTAEAKVVIPVLVAVALNEKANQGVRDETLRLRAIEALGNLGQAGRPALPVLETLVKEQDFKYAAKASIRRIKGEDP